MPSTAPTTVLAGAVVTMTDRGVLRDQAITIADGRITGIEPRESHQAAEAGHGVVVDWRERTVVPGLADCHEHVEEEADLLLNLAHGVTTVRNMRGKPWHLRWRQLVAEGTHLGPHIVTSTPMADGRGKPGTTVWPNSALIDGRETAHRAVERWAGLGYDQVKAYQWLSEDALRGLGEACRSTGLPLVGHCPQELTVDQAIDCGQTGFEHLNNYEYAALRPEARERLDAFFAQGFSYGRDANRFSAEPAQAACDIDDARMADLAQRLADEDITSCPTLIVFDGLLGPRNVSDPRLRLVDPIVARTWMPENDFRIMAVPPAELNATADLFRHRNLRTVAALREAGARVLVGTDAHNPFVFHGSSMVEEMELLVQAGYGHAEVVEMATRGAADYLGLTDRGRVDVGFVADLVAVQGDPTTSVSALRDPAAVVVGGRVLERSDLDGLLDRAEALLHAEPDRNQLQAAAGDEQHVGDYRRTSFEDDEALTRVSTAHVAAGRTRWREQVVKRHWAEVRTAVIDDDGVLVSAEVERRRPEGVETGTVVADEDGASYRVRTRALDGSGVDTVVPGPLHPGADLGVPALLASARVDADRETWPVLTLTTSLSNSLDPVPGSVEREADRLLQRTTDALVRVGGDGSLDEYTLVAPMEDLVHRRSTGTA